MDDKNYFLTLMRYAQILQPYSPNGEDIKELIQEKINLYSIGEDNNKTRDAWKTIMAIFLRKADYTTLERLKSNETLFRNPSCIFGITEKNPHVTKLVEWVKSLPIISEHLTYASVYCSEIDESGKTLAERNKTYSLRALRSPRDVMWEYKYDSERFVVIPLLTWSLENLIVYNLYSSDMDSFLRKEYIPLMKKHRVAYLEFRELVLEDRKSIVKEREVYESEDPLKMSKIFNASRVDGEAKKEEKEKGIRRDDTGKILELDVKINFTITESLSLDMFTSYIQTSIDNGYTMKRSDEELKQVLKARSKNPLGFVYIMHFEAEKLGVLASWLFPIPSTVLSALISTANSQSIAYSQNVLKALSLSGIRSFVETPDDSEEKTIVRWRLLRDVVLDNILSLESSKLLYGKTIEDMRAYISEVNVEMDRKLYI